MYYVPFSFSRLNDSYAKLPEIPGLASSFTVTVWVKGLDGYGPVLEWIKPVGTNTYIWGNKHGVWGRPESSGAEGGSGISVHYTGNEQQQWLHVSFSVDDQGNTRLCFNGVSRGTTVQPPGVAGNLNLASEMYLGNSPMSGTVDDRYYICCLYDRICSQIRQLSK